MLGYGLLFGSSGEFSPEAKANFKRSGTSHLVAVSGYNVSIITSNIFDLLRSASKNFAGVFSFFTLLAFYVMTGGSASVLRASVMGAFVLLAKFIGRRVLPLHLLLLAASLILVFNPYAIYDWGFQLSFLATAGLFFLSPAIETILSLGKFKSILIKILSETLAAQIFVLPILAANFGQFSLIAPLSNLFIIPFVPIAMVFIALSFGFYAFSSYIGIFFGGLSNILLWYIMAVINLSASFKYSSINITVKPVYGYLIGYLIVVLFTIGLRRISEKKSNEDI